jgi:hypothetical protein
LYRRIVMPRGDKSKYTDKQERKADHIAEGYEKRGVPEQEAERRAWATLNKDEGWRVWARQVDRPSGGSQRWREGRCSLGVPPGSESLRVREEGSGHTQAVGLAAPLIGMTRR